MAEKRDVISVIRDRHKFEDRMGHLLHVLSESIEETGEMASASSRLYCSMGSISDRKIGEEIRALIKMSDEYDEIVRGW